MSGIKQLAGQTVWYGISNVGKKMLSVLLTPLLTYLLHDDKGLVDFGNITLIFSWTAVANIIFTYGMETAYFRFSSLPHISQKRLFDTSLSSITITTTLLCLTLCIFRYPIERFLGLRGHTEYIIWIAVLIGLDTLSAIPFARLRQEGRPKKYAFINLFSILCNIVFVIIFVGLLPRWANTHHENNFSHWYLSKDNTGYIILGNVLENIIIVLLLINEWKIFRFKMDFQLLKRLLHYSMPMLVIGLAGMVNEVMDRTFLDKWLPYSPDMNKRIVAIYSANYRIAIFISLFVQAFRMAAEPFFFNQSKNKNSPFLYARIMKWFVITLGIAFLFTALFLDVWEYVIIQSSAYEGGRNIVPILLLANICLGVYYNLAIWYKLTNKMIIGLYITLIGSAITVVINYIFIPKYGMYASAMATFSCYLVMMAACYLLGQKYFPVPYNIKKIVAYWIAMLLLYSISTIIMCFTNSLFVEVLTGILLLSCFVLLVLWAEKRELQSIPILNRYVKRLFH